MISKIVRRNEEAIREAIADVEAEWADDIRESMEEYHYDADFDHWLEFLTWGKRNGLCMVLKARNKQYYVQKVGAELYEVQKGYNPDDIRETEQIGDWALENYYNTWKASPLLVEDSPFDSLGDSDE